MLKGKGLPNTFRAEAVNTTVHILNRSYTKAVKGKTPQEAWSGKKPSVAYFCTFGCECFMHVPDASRTKWDSKSRKCIFLGYSMESKGYLLYDPKAKKIVVSRDVVFREQPHLVEEEALSTMSSNEEVTQVTQPPVMTVLAP